MAKQKLPPYPMHPEPHAFRWTALEVEAITTYGKVCEEMGHLRGLAEARQTPPVTLDAFDEHDLCDAWAGLPIEFFNPGPTFGLVRGGSNG